MRVREEEKRGSDLSTAQPFACEAIIFTPSQRTYHGLYGHFRSRCKVSHLLVVLFKESKQCCGMEWIKDNTPNNFVGVSFLLSWGWWMNKSMDFVAFLHRDLFRLKFRVPKPGETDRAGHWIGFLPIMIMTHGCVDGIHQSYRTCQRGHDARNSNINPINQAIEATTKFVAASEAEQFARDECGNWRKSSNLRIVLVLLSYE
jgi:hypothetical protein